MQRLSDTLQRLGEVLDAKLFDLGATPVTVSTLLSVVFIAALTLVLSRIVRHGVTRVLSRTRGGAKAAGTLTGILHYVVLLVGLSIALQTIGIDLSSLFAAGALFAVALGFAMQSITENFVAGFILLAERSIKPGDILHVEGKTVKVLDLGIRAITAESRDGEHLVIPNAVVIGSTVTNYTLSHSALRIHVPVGVVYASDMKQVRSTLEAVARRLNDDWGVADRRPSVFMTEFGNHAVHYDVGIWIADPWEQRPRMSEMYEAIWHALKEQDVVIAFPQLDVHLDPPVAAGLARIGGVPVAG